MAVQSRSDILNTPFIRQGESNVKESETILQDAGRLTPLLSKTLMAKIATGPNIGKWVPFSDETALDGTAIPQGIYLGSDIPAADLVAGDIVDIPILVPGGNTIFTKSDLVIENSKTLDTVITVGTTDLRTVEDRLIASGLIPEDTVDIEEFENP